MKRYIDADEIVYFNDTGENRPIEGALVAYKGQIDRIPSADVAPIVHAHWVVEDLSVLETYTCSACKHVTAYFGFKYCPECGAKMDESEASGND